MILRRLVALPLVVALLATTTRDPLADAPFEPAPDAGEEVGTDPAPADDAPAEEASAASGTDPIPPEGAWREPQGTRGATGEPSDAPVTWAQVGRDAGYVFGRPAHLDGRGWARLGLAIGAGVGLYAVRDDVAEFAFENQEDTPHGVMDSARLMSRLATPLALATGLFIAGAATGSERTKETGSIVLESLVFASAITGISQRILATERPRNGDDITWFGQDGHSVSGDVTIAASMLAPIIDRYLLVEPEDSGKARAWKRAGAWTMYGAVGLIGLQRLHVGAHYLPDVYFGYLNGLMVGKMIVDSRKGGRAWRDERRARRVEFSITPDGVRIAWPVRPAPAPGADAVSGDAVGTAGRR